MVDEVQTHFGKVDILINNAAWTVTADALDVSEEEMKLRAEDFLQVIKYMLDLRNNRNKAHIDDIDDSNLFVIGAATKGLQAPGIRVGWIVASREHVEILSNFSSFGMGGVSHPSQLYAVELFGEERIEVARQAVPAYYGEMRRKYAEAFDDLGLDLFSGDGGFYHWCRLPEGLSAEEFNQRLFKQGAAVLKGTDCDMARLGDESSLANFFRFSFGPLAPESFDSDIAIMRQALDR